MLQSPSDAYKIIGKISHVPVKEKSLYAFDIDITLIHENFKDGKNENTVQPEDIEHLWKIKEVSTIIYITSRAPEMKETTLEEFEKFNIPMGEIFFTYSKSIPLKEYLIGKEFENVFFIDDFGPNCREMARCLPGVITCRYHPWKYEELMNHSRISRGKFFNTNCH